mmetsp:Transcript_54246/g.124938  ORF Transcript_54246/g.124938 Transcript_54246/m.124938 type:complete len:236 (-) Transcript_54246:725-1432(-)
MCGCATCCVCVDCCGDHGGSSCHAGGRLSLLKAMCGVCSSIELSCVGDGCTLMSVGSSRRRGCSCVSASHACSSRLAHWLVSGLGKQRSMSKERHVSSSGSAVTATNGGARWLCWRQNSLYQLHSAYPLMPGRLTSTMTRSKLRPPESKLIAASPSSAVSIHMPSSCSKQEVAAAVTAQLSTCKTRELSNPRCCAREARFHSDPARERRGSHLCSICRNVAVFTGTVITSCMPAS